MAIAILVIFWVLVGLGVFLVAMRRGPRARDAQRKPSKAGRRLTALGLTAAIVVFGIAVPVLVLGANADDDAKATGGVELTSAQRDGRVLWRENCATCHTLAATNSVGKVGPNLDQLSAVRAASGNRQAAKQAETFVVNAIKQGRARGQGQMPAELLQGDEADKVASFVVAVAGRGN